METKTKTYRGAISVTFITMFFIGGGNIMLSATKESIMSHFSVGLFEIGVLFTIRGIVSGLVPIICGSLSDRFGRKAIILAGGLLYIAYYILVPRSSDFSSMYFLIVLFSVAYSFVDPAGMAILFDAMPNPTPAVPFIQVFFASGAVFAPLVASTVLQMGKPWQITYYFYAGLSLAMCLYIFFIKFPPTVGSKSKADAKSYFDFAIEPKPLREGLIIFAFAMCNSMLFNVITNWTDIYMKDVFNYPAAEAIKALSYIQIGGVLGAFFMSRVSRKLSATNIIRLWPAFSLCTLIIALLMPSSLMFIICIMLTSFTAGCMFSVVVGYSGMLFYKNSGASTGAVSSATAAGIAVSSLISGRLIGMLGVRSVFFVMCTFGIVSIILGQVIHLRHGKLIKRS